MINVLHICSIGNEEANGISKIVPQYIMHQKDKANVGLLNCNKERIKILENEKNIFYIDEIGKIENMIGCFGVPDIVIFHGIYFFQYIKIANYLRKNNIKYIIIPHGSLTKYAQKIKKIKKILGNLLFFKRFVKGASAIQYLSEYERDNTIYKEKKNYVIGNGMDIIPNKNMYLSSKKLDKFNIVYVGRYDYYVKGIDRLINAMRNINDEDIILNLYGVGEKKYIKKIKNEINKYNLNKKIIVNEPVYNDAKQNIIIQNYVFIQVSRTEAQPLGVMEALTLGMPVILSNGTGYQKIIKEENIGILVQEEKDIENAIIKMKENNKLLNQYSEHAYNYAQKNYNWELISINSINEYKKILNGD